MGDVKAHDEMLAGLIRQITATLTSLSVVALFAPTTELIGAHVDR